MTYKLKLALLNFLHIIKNTIMTKLFFKQQPLTQSTAFADIITQLTQEPLIQKISDPVRDYCIKETMAALELSYLQSDLPIMYHGRSMWYDSNNTAYLTFIPCALRPEVLYCSYGKN
jgi:hypothetical protein